MTLDVIIPVYNEEDTLKEVLERVLASPLEPTIIAVDDGSSDGSPAILEQYANNERVRVASHEGNLGKGAAVRTGIALASGDVVLVQDADLEYDPDDYGAILAPFADPAVEVVYGSRRLNRTNPTGSPMFLMGGVSLTWITNLLYGTGITDEPTCYTAFRRELLQTLPLSCMRFEFCPRSLPWWPEGASRSTRCPSAMRRAQRPKGRRSASATGSRRYTHF